MTASRAASTVAPWPTEVAGQRRSPGNSSGSIATLTPIPITAQSGGRASISTPATFASSIQTSFGHLIRASTGASDSIASQTATGTESGSSSVLELERAQDRREQQRLARRRRPDAPAAAAPGALLAGGDHRAARRPGLGQLAGAVVGRVGARAGAGAGCRTPVTSPSAATRSPGARSSCRDASPRLTASASERAESTSSTISPGLGVGEGERVDRLVGAPRTAHPQALADLEPGVVGVGRGRDQRQVAEGVDVPDLGLEPQPRLDLGLAAVDRRQRRRVDRLAELGRAASPSARCAATGANRSRPWKVAETGSRRTGELGDVDGLDRAAEALERQREQAVVGADEDPVVLGGARPRPAAARCRPRDRRPRGGRPPARTRRALASTAAPWPTSWRAIPWLRSITRASGAIRAITARQTPANSSLDAVVGEEGDRAGTPRNLTRARPARRLRC